MLYPVAVPAVLAPSLLDELALSALVITVGSCGEESGLRPRAECVSLCSCGQQGILTVLVLTPLCLSSPLDTSCLLWHTGTCCGWAWESRSWPQRRSSPVWDELMLCWRDAWHSWQR